MTPPIGFRTGKNDDSNRSLMEIRPVAAIADSTGAPPQAAAPSRVADYAYRIAALTAGIALLASVW